MDPAVGGAGEAYEMRSNGTGEELQLSSGKFRHFRGSEECLDTYFYNFLDTAQDGPRRPQHGPRQPQDGPSWLSSVPRRPKAGPRRPQTPQDTPKTPQDPLKSPPH